MTPTAPIWSKCSVPHAPCAGCHVVCPNSTRLISPTLSWKRLFASYGPLDPGSAREWWRGGGRGGLWVSWGGEGARGGTRMGTIQILEDNAFLLMRRRARVAQLLGAPTGVRGALDPVRAAVGQGGAVR